MNKRKVSKFPSSLQLTDDEDAQSYKLHTLLNVKQIVALKDRFEKLPGRHMCQNGFRKSLMEVGHILMTDRDFENLCNKLNYARTISDIYWEDFLTHISVGLDSETCEKFAGKLELPINGFPKEIKTLHRLPVSRIIFIPEIQQDRAVNNLYGVYLTCSRDGLINYWSMDMEHERTVYSKSPKLKSQSTWITDIIALPDVNVILTSSSERDLRFYDTTAKKFELRLIITSLEDMVTAMNYTFYEDESKLSKLLLGNSAGKLKLVFIDTKDRGPFQSLPKMPLRSCTYSQFVKGVIDGMRVVDIPTEHTDWVRQVSYYENIHCVVSVSMCSKQSMLIYSSKSGKENCSYTFSVPKGFSCIAIANALHLIITGGPDGLVRVWNPFSPSRAITIFRGHHAGIVSITLQDDNRILISLDQDKCIRVWDVAEQSCVQSYFGLPSSLGERTPLCTHYNPCSRQLFIASHKICYFQVYPLLNGEYTDGISHNKEVSVILYNSLFKTIITCGFDSFIIIWNPWQGKRIQFIREAHTNLLYGEIVPVEITAAAFDPTQQFLITGASDGTIKVWNFIVKICIRNMSICRNCEIYSIVWIPFRILVMGENRVVTEFADCDDIGSSTSKAWMRRHQDDILCAATYLPQMLVTGSYSGELVFWRMETGQPYGVYNVLNPRKRIKMQYQMGNAGTKSGQKPSLKKRVLTEESKKISTTSTDTSVSRSSTDMDRRVSINAMICLISRPVHPQIGTLLVALDDGIIQMWSNHPGGGYLTQFNSIHTATDYVVALCTDQKNQYLFTGHMAGYVKTWHLVNFGVPDDKQEHVCMPSLRLQFPFMWKDTFRGRAKKAHNSNVPLLLNCFRAHLKAVTGIIFIDQVEILMSCSSDGSARIWTLGGRYMGTLGTFKPWTFISPVMKPDNSRQYTFPADIKRSASSTTFRVLNGGTIEKTLSKKQQQLQFEHSNYTSHTVYGKRVQMDAILGKHFKLPVRGFRHYDIVLDTTLPDVPIYSEIITPMPDDIERPPTPELMKSLKAQQRITMTCNTFHMSH